MKQPEIAINGQDWHGKTALHHAVEENNIDIVKILINDPKTKCGIKDRRNETPLKISLNKIQQINDAYKMKKPRGETRFSQQYIKTAKEIYNLMEKLDDDCDNL